MSEDTSLDPSTGLLRRTAFLETVRESQASLPPSVRRGCLLLLYFPGLQGIVRDNGADAANDILRDLLALVESRLRKRDKLGRIKAHSLCVLLHQCRESDALKIANQYVGLLNGGVMDEGMSRAIRGLYYRIVPLDARGSRPRQNIVRSGSSAAKKEAVFTQRGPQLQTLSMPLAIANVVVLDRERMGAGNEASYGTGSASASASALPLSGDKAWGTIAAVQKAWRLKPGVVLRQEPLVCCHRVLRVGFSSVTQPLSEIPALQLSLDALALHAGNTHPLVDSQLMLNINAGQLSTDAVSWLKERCESLRVAPSDLCFSLDLESVSKDLQGCTPLLRELNRQGVKLMLQGVSSVPQFLAMQNLAVFDFLEVSSQLLQGSANHYRRRHELETLVTVAHAHQREVCVQGVDTPALFAHALSLGMDIGFGRNCGRSVAFPGVGIASLDAVEN